MVWCHGYPKGARNLPGLLHPWRRTVCRLQSTAEQRQAGICMHFDFLGSRISAPGYRVTSNEVKLFWDGKVNDPKYKLTTDWGALDAHHAPSRYGKDAFPSIPVADWTLDAVESPRNNGWFLANSWSPTWTDFFGKDKQKLIPIG